MNIAPRLFRIDFIEEDVSAVQDFACGGEPWEVYLSQWITNTVKDDKGVIDCLREGTKVWLYLTGDGDIVGYGSLGITTWKYPNPYGSDGATFAVIPAFAVSSAFHGQPPGDWSQRYSTEILIDLIEAAKSDYLANAFPNPAVGLFVDTRNARAMKLYSRMGFMDYGKPLKRTGYFHQRMLLTLDVSPPTSEVGRAHP